MTVCGKVVGVDSEKGIAVLITAPPSSCNGNCSECASCAEQRVEVTVFNPQNCKIGDLVRAQIYDRPPFNALFIVYLYPVFLALAGIAVYNLVSKSAELVAGTVAAVGIALWFVLMKLSPKIFKPKPRGYIIEKL